MKNANQPADSSTKNKQRDDLIDFSKRLDALVSALKIEKREFAKTGGITAQTLSGYLAAIREPGASVLSAWVSAYNVNANWLLAGIGQMLIVDQQPQANDQTPLEREMDKFVALMKQHNASDEEIKRGLLAKMGSGGSPDKTTTYTTAESPANFGHNHVHEPGTDWDNI